MAAIRKRGSVYHVQIRLAGHAPETATFARLAEARAWALEREEALRSGRLSSASMTLGAALARYAAEVSPGKRGAKWERVRLAKIGREWALCYRPIDRITGADIAAWRDERLRAVSPASVAREMNLLRSVFEIARREWQVITFNPMVDIRRPRSPPARRRRIAQDEIDRLCLALGYTGAASTTSDRVALSFLFAIETAMRAGEIINMRWSDVHLGERYVRLPRTKNGDAREVGLSTRAIKILKMLDRSTDRVFDLSSGTRDALFRRARDRAGIVDLHYHDSRAEAVWRLSERLNVQRLAITIGHRDIRSLMLYYSESATDIARLLG